MIKMLTHQCISKVMWFRKVALMLWLPASQQVMFLFFVQTLYESPRDSISHFKPHDHKDPHHLQCKGSVLFTEYGIEVQKHLSLNCLMGPGWYGSVD